MQKEQVNKKILFSRFCCMTTVVLAKNDSRIYVWNKCRASSEKYDVCIYLKFYFQKTISEKFR